MAAALAMAVPVSVPVPVAVATARGTVIVTLLALLFRSFAVMAMHSTFSLALVVMSMPAATRALPVDVPHDHARAYELAQQFLIVDCHSSILSSVINKLPYFMNRIIVRFLTIYRRKLRI